VVLNLGIFVRHPGIYSHSIIMSALHHERARRHQFCQLTVVERVPKVKRKDGIFFVKQEAERDIVPADFPDAFIDIG
jgi:hypothetical protein